MSNGDKPPAGPDQVPLPQPHEVTTTPWSEPAPGQAGGVSSARPDDLRTYSSNVTGANDTVTTQKGTLEGAITDFAARCSWCSIDASGITAALASFGANNTNETRWVDTVAAAFEAAGGSGAISAVSDAALDASLQAAGVTQSRRPVDVTAPSILGDPQTSGYADDPVNTTTGNFTEPETDLAFDGGCASLGFDRVYNSLSAGIGAFGPGWASTADQTTAPRRRRRNLDPALRPPHPVPETRRQLGPGPQRHLLAPHHHRHHRSRGPCRRCCRRRHR